MSRPDLRVLLPVVAVFLGSACIMVVELVAGRLIARFLGQSLYTWTSVIGLILAGISVGNVLGGRLADRFDPRRLLAVMFLVSAVLSLLSPLVNAFAGRSLFLCGLDSRTRIFIHVALTFLPPAIALGTIGPVAAGMAVKHGEQCVGRTLGAIYAWGAAGSIAGTFVTGYYLIATLGTAVTLLIAAGVLLLLALLFGATSWTTSGRLRLLVVCFATWAVGAMACGPRNARLWTAVPLQVDGVPLVTLWQKESPYSQVTVAARKDLQRYRMLYLDKLTHSSVDVDHATNLLASYVWMLDGAIAAQSAPPAPVSALVIGGGGYTLPASLQAERPGSRILVAEIDPVVTEAAEVACGLAAVAVAPLDRLEPLLPSRATGAPIRVVHQDGRQVVQQLVRQVHSVPGTPAAPSRVPYDFVIGDTIEYYSIPFHLTTREFNDEVASLLAPSGVYLLHVVADDQDAAPYLGALVNTLRRTFHCVRALRATASLTRRTSIVLLASRMALDVDRVATTIRTRHPEYAGGVVSAAELERCAVASGGVVLTDDFAPVEQLVASAVRHDQSDWVSRELNDASVCIAQGQSDAADAAIRTVLASDPGNPSALYLKAMQARRAAGYREGLACVDAILSLDGSVFPARILRGELLALLDRVPEAAREWETVLVTRPKNIDALNDLAYAEEYQGNTGAAEERWKGVLTLKGTDATAHFGLARIYTRKGDPERAAWHREQARKYSKAGDPVRSNPMPLKTAAQILEQSAL